MKNENTALAAYTFGHFCMDGFCLFLYAYFFESSPETILTAYLVYHAFSFMMQPFLGMLCDRFPKPNYSLVSACLAAFALALCGFVPYAALALAGISNTFFHLDGGYVSLHRKGRSIAPGGIFVGGGAIGVSVGRILATGFEGSFLPFFFACLMVVALFLIAIFFSPDAECRKRNGKFGIISEYSPAAIAVLSFVSIMVRGFAGSLTEIHLNTGVTANAVIISLAVLAGKMSGGFIVEKFGIARTSAAALLLAAVAFCIPGAPVIALVGVFLMNIPMSVTLAALSDSMPENTGFAFGLAPLALIISNTFGAFFVPEGTAKTVILAVLLCVSAVIMLLTLKKTK